MRTVCVMPKKSTRKGALWELREKLLKQTQAEFASELGISVSFLQKLEYGEKQLDSDVLCRIFLATGVTPEELLSEDGQNKPRLENSFTKQRVQHWRATMLNQLDQATLEDDPALVFCIRLVNFWSEVILRAAAKGNRGKLLNVCNSFLVWTNNTAKKFDIRKNVENSRIQVPESRKISWKHGTQLMSKHLELSWLAPVLRAACHGYYNPDIPKRNTEPHKDLATIATAFDLYREKCASIKKKRKRKGQ